MITSEDEEETEIKDDNATSSPCTSYEMSHTQIDVSEGVMETIENSLQKARKAATYIRKTQNKRVTHYAITGNERLAEFEKKREEKEEEERKKEERKKQREEKKKKSNKQEGPCKRKENPGNKSAPVFVQKRGYRRLWPSKNWKR